MFRPLYSHRIRGHAEKLTQWLFPSGYDGEFFFCGGAFKPVIHRKHAVHDYDLWVRDRNSREDLCRALLKRGAHLVKDYHPYCAHFRLDGQLIEITYHNVGDGTIQNILDTFDLTTSAVGARYADHQIQEIHFTDEHWESIQLQRITVQSSNMGYLLMEKCPTLLRTLHRMAQYAVELGFEVDADCEHQLWRWYWQDYSEEQRKACMDLYFDTMVTHTGKHDTKLVNQAIYGYAPVMAESADLHPLMDVGHPSLA